VNLKQGTKTHMNDETSNGHLTWNICCYPCTNVHSISSTFSGKNLLPSSEVYTWWMAMK